MSTDSEIVERSWNAPQAFGELFDRHAPAVARYAIRRIGEGDSQDVVSETFLVAFKKRRGYDLTRADARPWLFGIATLIFQDHRRTEAKLWRSIAASSSVALLHDVTGDIDSRLDAGSAVKRMARDIRKMPDHDRDVLLLHAWGDLDYLGIAEALDIPIGTVRSRLNRARRVLRIAGDTNDQKEVDHERTVIA